MRYPMTYTRCDHCKKVLDTGISDTISWLPVSFGQRQAGGSYDTVRYDFCNRDCAVLFVTNAVDNAIEERQQIERRHARNVSSLGTQPAQ